MLTEKLLQIDEARDRVVAEAVRLADLLNEGEPPHPVALLPRLGVYLGDLCHAVYGLIDADADLEGLAERAGWEEDYGDASQDDDSEASAGTSEPTRIRVQSEPLVADEAPLESEIPDEDNSARPSWISPNCDPGCSSMSCTHTPACTGRYVERERRFREAQGIGG